ncbi:protein of unknown function (plasmid) [Cupriavidus neocaledonicus]|uniref:Uncharacterized protein n=1 Tax=Cupriavidus neocaledonicus TaxID=1040979 RepID=A0A375HPC5_9BURK|nr:protein of unknown function [Cupriavidus neocaledonicus]
MDNCPARLLSTQKQVRVGVPNWRNGPRCVPISAKSPAKAYPFLRQPQIDSGRLCQRTCFCGVPISATGLITPAALVGVPVSACSGHETIPRGVPVSASDFAEVWAEHSPSFHYTRDLSRKLVLTPSVYVMKWGFISAYPFLRRFRRAFRHPQAAPGRCLLDPYPILRTRMVTNRRKGVPDSANGPRGEAAATGFRNAIWCVPVSAPADPNCGCG